jgi:hypothetical protein
MGMLGTGAGPGMGQAGLSGAYGWGAFFPFGYNAPARAAKQALKFGQPSRTGEAGRCPARNHANRDDFADDSRVSS